MATIHMLIGIPGSGKSTYCKNVLRKKYPHAVVVASDEVRNQHPEMNESQIWPEIFSLCAKALLNNQDLIYDATNITPTVRNKFFLELANRNCTIYDKVAYYFNTKTSLCIKRVRIRNKDVNERYLPIAVIGSYGKKIIAPTIEEAFKDIIIIDNNETI